MKVTCYASSFADPADIDAFRRCKARGGSDQDCFKVGDNGIGFWGDDVSQGSGAACALPPEVIDQLGLSRGSPVHIFYQEKDVIALLLDHMPHIKHLANAARIDLNPDACSELGIAIPAMVVVTYETA